MWNLRFFFFFGRQISGFPGPQISKFLDSQAPRSPNSQISKFPDFQVPRFPAAAGAAGQTLSLTPLPTHPGIKYVARAFAAIIGNTLDDFLQYDLDIKDTGLHTIAQHLSLLCKPDGQDMTLQISQCFSATSHWCRACISLIFPVYGKNGLRWPQIGPGGFFSF